MQFGQLRRRQFISLLGGIAATWSLSSHAQQRERMRRIGAMMLLAEDDPEQKTWTETFLNGLQEAGWMDRRNMEIDYRWGAGDSVHVAIRRNWLRLRRMSSWPLAASASDHCYR
jgi:putative ABC transport system substrate-binding protein